MTSSDLRNHFLGIVRSTPIIFTSTSYFIFTVFNPRICACGCVAVKSANKDPTKMDAYWTYVLSRLTFQLTISKFRSTKQSTAEYNRTLDADQALLSMETSTDFVTDPR
ncbi:hypothetical protein T02_16303 [Trichinella nativa]|uniref:Uncharacterized protein n=2 Tax=Trichinella TaxID=6333 RepID=A0A0V1KJH0_9BILA|nr:hypothetical protein T02_16303 [Trichinella nativa]